MNKVIYRLLMGLLLALMPVMGFSVSVAGADSDTVRLDTPDESGNIAFGVENMFPGDAKTKDFTIKVKHKKPITLYYHADIRSGSEKLAEVMMVKIELPEKDITLYDGLMRDMPSALEHQLVAEEKEIVYRITVYLHTSVGNEYQYKSLIADFRWWYEEEITEEDPEADNPSPPIQPDTPKTGDDSNIYLYSVLLLGSMATLIFLLIFMNRKKGEAVHE